MKLVINRHEIIDMDVADTFLSRMKGLMFKKEIKRGLWITPCNSIHTFFMRTKIDVLYLDAKGKIIKMTPSIKPWRIGPVVWKAKSVLELPAGTIQKMDIQLNHVVYFKK